MSVVVILKLKADRTKVEAMFTTRRDVILDVVAEARRRGAAHHQFAAADGEVVIVDEWESAEAFEGFFNGEMRVADLMTEAGVPGPPEVAIYEILDSPDRF